MNKPHDTNRFGTYIKELRDQYGITLEGLSEGLCSPGFLARLEDGKRQPDKLLQDRLLERLGVQPDEYEYLLAQEEYDRWRDRQRILRAIMEQRWDQVRRLLEDYRQTYDMTRDLERQFYLAMEAQYRWNTGDRDGLAEQYREAVCLTVPGFEEDLPGQVLSAQEINLILEYYHHSQEPQAAEVYRRVLSYVEDPRFDPMSQSKLYPKTVYYLWEEEKRRGGPDENSTENLVEDMAKVPACPYCQLLKYCDRGIEMLRADQSLYYLWELLSLRQELLQGWERQGFSTEEERVWYEQKKAEQEERTLWRDTLEAAYEEYGIPVGMYHFCYLYEENEVYEIGKVIQLRRTMLGIKATKLCDGICSTKTLRRLEHHEMRMQRSIAEELLERLGLPTEYRRTELVTDSPEAKQMMKELRRRINQGDYREADRLMDQIGQRISMDIPFNRQVLAHCHAISEESKGEITTQEYIRWMTEALEITLPLETALADGEKYMTNEELQCIHSMVLHQDTEGELTRRCVRMLMQFYRRIEEEECETAYFSMYRIVMSRIASYLGNLGLYEESDRISRRILRGSLLKRETVLIDSEYYNIYWNHTQLQKENILPTKKQDMIAELENCLMWSVLRENQYGIHFYGKKLDELRRK